MCARSIDVRIFEKLPEELRNLHRFMDMMKEIEVVDDELRPYLNPLVIDYWNITENVQVYQSIKQDDVLAKRCFLYLKQIKYLHRDVEKLTKQIERYKELYIKFKREAAGAEQRFNYVKKRLDFYENEKKKDYIPKLKYAEQFDEEFEIEIIEDHNNEFKARNICYDFGENYSMQPRSLKNITKSIIGFLNADGGTLYIGIEDSGLVNGIKFVNREHLDQFMKQIDNYFVSTLPQVVDKFYDYEFWKVGNCAVVVLIKVQKQKEKEKKKYVIQNSNTLYIRCHSITRKIDLSKDI